MAGQHKLHNHQIAVKFPHQVWRQIEIDSAKSAVVSTRGEPQFVREQDIDPFFQEPNATHLRRAIADMEAGRNIVEHDLIKA